MQYCSVFAEFELLTLMATFLPSLHLGVEYGTIIGIGVDLLMITFHHAKPSVKVYNKWNFFFRPLSPISSSCFIGRMSADCY